VWSPGFDIEEVMMRVVIDYDRCESNAVCMGILPEVFEVRDDNFLYVLNENPPEQYRDKLLQAVASCPTQAISLVED
jgi:ferredoxin